MEFYEGPAWALVTGTVMGVMLVHVGADFGRLLAASGTRPRFGFTTLIRVTMYPTLVGILLFAAENLASRDYPRLGLFFGFALCWVWFIVRFRRDDDDDWFNTGGPGRVRNRLARWFSGGRGVVTQD